MAQRSGNMLTDLRVGDEMIIMCGDDKPYMMQAKLLSSAKDIRRSKNGDPDFRISVKRVVTSNGLAVRVRRVVRDIQPEES